MTQLVFNPRQDYLHRREHDLGWPCTLTVKREGKLVPVCDTCWHGCCKLAYLRSIGLASLATRFENNWKARDYRGNWGKLLYDPRSDGRHPAKRSAMAKVIRAMRNNSIDTVGAIVGGAWAGALID